MAYNRLLYRLCNVYPCNGEDNVCEAVKLFIDNIDSVWSGVVSADKNIPIVGSSIIAVAFIDMKIL